VREKHDAASEAFRLWIDNGRPRLGSICDEMRKTMFPIVCWEKTGVQYSNNGRAHIINAFIRMVLYLIVKLLRISIAGICALRTMD